VIRKQLLRQRLVARQDEAARIAPGVGEAEQLEIADHVLIERRHTRERLHQIEDDVRLEQTDGWPDAAKVVVDAEDTDLVTDLAQRLDHVVLHLPLGFEDVDARGVLWRDEMIVDEREDAEFLHRNSRCPPL
jgi:hypothetical protein